MSVIFELELFSFFGDDAECKEFVRDVNRQHAEFLGLYERKKKQKIEAEESLRQALIVEWREEKNLNSQLDAEQGNLYIENGEIDSAVKHTYKEMRDFKRDYAPNEKLSLPADIKRFNTTVAELEDAHNAASQAQVNYNLRVASWKNRKAAQNKKVQELEDEIGRCWRIVQRLEGKRVPIEYSRETGLPIMDFPIQTQGVGDVPENRVVHKKLVPGVGPYPVER